MREIITRWTTPAGGGFVTVMYFEDTAHSVADQRARLGEFWLAVKDELSSSVTYTVAQEGRVMEPSTGAVTGGWTDAPIYTGNGGSSSTPVPDSSQVLVRWLTGEYRDGRQVRGRSFIPGMRYDALAAGNLNPAVVAEIQGEATAFVNAAIGFGIWRRPKPGRAGILELVSTANVWSEFAVQRGRRQ